MADMGGAAAGGECALGTVGVLRQGAGMGCNCMEDLVFQPTGSSGHGTKVYGDWTWANLGNHHTAFWVR